MNKDSFLKRLAFVLASISMAVTQSVVAEDDNPEMEEVVVTGSYIARAVEEQSNPVDVYDRSEWEEQGSPQMVEIIRNTPAMSGTLNQSEQYAGSGVATGLKNINIRGLGAERSLVLMNGKGWSLPARVLVKAASTWLMWALSQRLPWSEWNFLRTVDQ